MEKNRKINNRGGEGGEGGTIIRDSRVANFGPKGEPIVAPSHCSKFSTFLSLL